MYDTNIESIGKNIKYFRHTRNMSIESLGKAINKSKATIARYENSEIVPDILTILEICNVFNIDFNDICTKLMHTVEEQNIKNPFDNNKMYLYYISNDGIIISSLEITESNTTHYVLMKNGITNSKYKQEYTGVLESNYNTAFFCLTNSVTNPRT